MLFEFCVGLGLCCCSVWVVVVFGWCLPVFGGFV